MVKKTLISGAVLALLVGLLFGRDSISYVGASLGLVRDSVREAIPVEFEINAKRMVKDLELEIARNMAVIAREEVELRQYHPKAGFGMDGALAKSKSEIMRGSRPTWNGATPTLCTPASNTPANKWKLIWRNASIAMRTKEQTVERLASDHVGPRKGFGCRQRQVEGDAIGSPTTRCRSRQPGDPPRVRKGCLKRRRKSISITVPPVADQGTAVGNQDSASTWPKSWSMLKTPTIPARSLWIRPRLATSPTK